jgi:hypothetical protein
VRPPSVEQLVAVAAHSFSASDLLRVDRLLLDALEWQLAAPTPYGCLHLLTQVCGGVVLLSRVLLRTGVGVLSVF